METEDKDYCGAGQEDGEMNHFTELDQNGAAVHVSPSQDQDLFVSSITNQSQTEQKHQREKNDLN